MTAPVRLRIAGGAVHDPANGVDGEIRDVCIEDGRIVATLPGNAPRLDARGMVVMPGGVDIHSHFASSSCNHARRLIPDEHAADPARAPVLADGEFAARSGTGGTVPSTFTTGYRYAGLGYTTAFDAAVAPLTARHSHSELDDTPCLDGGIYVLMGNDEYLLRQIESGETGRAHDYAAWMLGATGAYAIKIVNPGGVEAWKSGQRNVTGLDDAISGRKVTPRAVLETLAGAADALRLPHPVHIHCNNLGVPGNAATTLGEHAGTLGAPGTFHPSPVPLLRRRAGSGMEIGGGADHRIRQRPPRGNRGRGAGDVRRAMTVTADAPGRIPAAQEQREAVDQYRHRAGDRVRHRAARLQGQGGRGVAPMGHRSGAVPAERRPWRVVLSTDHPNGGSFLAYPALIQLLMDRTVRDEAIKRVNPKLLAGCALADGLAREYTLNEIAIVTRAGPARQLGLTQKGHLGAGADADVTVYSREADIAKMFSTPRYVIKDGALIVEEGQLRRAPAGRRLQGGARIR